DAAILLAHHKGLPAYSLEQPLHSMAIRDFSRRRSRGFDRRQILPALLEIQKSTRELPELGGRTSQGAKPPRVAIPRRRILLELVQTSRIHERTQDPPKNRLTSRRGLVGARTQRTRARLTLSAALPHQSRPSRILFHPHKSRRQALQPRLRCPGGNASRPNREKAPQPFPARHARVQHGDG